MHSVRKDLTGKLFEEVNEKRLSINAQQTQAESALNMNPIWVEKLLEYPCETIGGSKRKTNLF